MTNGIYGDTNHKVLKVLNSIIKVAYEDGFKDGKSSTSSSVEAVQETIEREGVILQKVNRKVSEGVYVRFHNTKYNSRLKDGVIYGPVMRMMTIDGYNVINEYHNRTHENVEVFEVVDYVDMLPEQELPLTANQHRAELIQRARDFYWRNLKGQHYLDDDTYVSFLNTNGYTASHDIYFVVNEEKRTVVALIKFNGKVTLRGIAKCMPGDVFNADIGKAIALARALEIEVPVEFLQAVQPNEKVLGMVVDWDGRVRRLAKQIKHKETCHPGSDTGRYGTIIDDTNAKYGEASQ